MAEFFNLVPPPPQHHAPHPVSESSDGFSRQPLSEVLPVVRPLSIEVLDNPKGHIDPNLAARLVVQKTTSPPKPRVEKKYTIHLTNGKLNVDDDSFNHQALDQALPKKNTQVMELLDPPRKPIAPALASRLVGTAA